MAESGILATIGNTPLVRLRRCAPASGAEVWVKLEYLNPTGSMKDRVALAMIEGAERDGLIDSETTVVEYTSGHEADASAVAALCRQHEITHVFNAVDPRFVNNVAQALRRRMTHAPLAREARAASKRETLP